MRKFLPFILLAVLLLVGVQSASAQSKSLHWERYDVTIDNVKTANNSFDVTEYYLLTIDSGTFRFGTASIPTDRMEGISNFSVSDGGTQLLPRVCNSLSSGYFCTEQSGSNLDVTYYFPGLRFDGHGQNASGSATAAYCQ